MRTDVNLSSIPTQYLPPQKKEHLKQISDLGLRSYSASLPVIGGVR